MTKTALTALKAATADSEQGFFIMVEGSRIGEIGLLQLSTGRIRR